MFLHHLQHFYVHILLTMMVAHLYNDVSVNLCNIVNFKGVRLLVIVGFVRGRTRILLIGGISCVLL